MTDMKELQMRYTKLCLKAGELLFQTDDINADLNALGKEVAEIKKEWKRLEQEGIVEADNEVKQPATPGDS